METALRTWIKTAFVMQMKLRMHRCRGRQLNPDATEENGSCTYTGCTDPRADNFHPLATSDSGTCEYTCIGTSGCTYVTATNYDPDVNCDNGTCEFPPIIDNTCMFDIDASGYIGASDLLIFLQYFEFNCN